MRKSTFGIGFPHLQLNATMPIPFAYCNSSAYIIVNTHIVSTAAAAAAAVNLTDRGYWLTGRRSTTALLAAHYAKMTLLRFLYFHEYYLINGSIFRSSLPVFFYFLIGSRPITWCQQPKNFMQIAACCCILLVGYTYKVDEPDPNWSLRQTPSVVFV